jgi:CPA1 family monovalent cation:H+ antiporter
VGLVFIGGLLAFNPNLASITITKSLIYKVFLPPLIFEAALFLPQGELLKNSGLIISMATAGVLLAALVTTCGMHWLLHWPWLSAGIFAALISATDPVSVIAIFKESGAPKRLKLLVEAESLLNDGTAAVLFTVLVSVALGQHYTPFTLCTSLLVMVGGSILCGFILARTILYFTEKTQAHLLELTFTTVIAYGSFLIAERLQLSGILATLTAGLVMGHKSTLTKISEKGRVVLEAFWEFLAFLANAMIFLLIGMHGIQQAFLPFFHAAMIAILIVLLGRAAAIYPLGCLFSKSRERISFAYQHVLFWGGLRGALALALALGLPEEILYRDDIISVTFLLVAFSIVVQGLTVKPLLKLCRLA